MTHADDDMPAEIDFAGARRGQFHQAGAQLNLPVYLEQQVQATLAALAQAPVLAQLPPLEPLTASGLAAQWQAQDLGRTLTAAMGAAPNPHR